MRLDRSLTDIGAGITSIGGDVLASFGKRQSLLSEVSCRGVGIHSGEQVNLHLLPAESGTGIVFRRLDMPVGQSDILAHYSNVIDSCRCTIIANEHGVVVSTIEHICSALVAMGVSDVIIALDGSEVPIMDGSARDFMALIDSAGVCELSGGRSFLRILRKVEVFGDDDGVMASLDISDDSVYSYDLDYDIMGHQEREFSFGRDNFVRDIGSARTFGFMADLQGLRERGYALGASCANTVAFGDGGVMNEGGLRYIDEPVRHKILDAIGDLSLGGYFILGSFRGVRSGHRLNSALLEKLFSDSDNFEIV